MSSSSVSELRDRAKELRQAATVLNEKADFLDQTAEGIETNLSGVEALLKGINLADLGSVIAVSSNGSSSKRGRPKGSKNKSKGDEDSGKRASNKTSLRELILQILNHKRGGLSLPDLVKECLSSGYKSTTKGKFSNIVYQNLYKLMKEEKAVEKDSESRKYSVIRKAA